MIGGIVREMLTTIQEETHYRIPEYGSGTEVEQPKV